MWEGSAADARVLEDALTRRNGLRVPHGNYYLVDGGYTNCEGFLAPFRGQRYHLSEWRDGQQPTSAEEFFNMKHAAARNFIVNQMDSPNARGRGKNKRQWTEEEDDALIEIMKELCNGGKYKADNGFRPGFPLAVEEALKAKLPGCDLKATPHINSRIRHFRSVFAIIHDMVVGKATSGFGWDSTKNCVTAPKDVWKDYLKGHPKARDYKDKSCPCYEDLCIIFGKDRATGKDSKDFADVVEEVNEEEANGPRDVITATVSSSTQVGAQVGAMNSTSSSQNKKARVADKWVKGITDAALILGKEIKAASTELSRAVSHDLLLSEKRLKINEELLQLNGLTMMERHKAGRKIACDHETTDLFFTIMDEEKEEWVLSLLRGDI